MKKSSLILTALIAAVLGAAAFMSVDTSITKATAPIESNLVDLSVQVERLSQLQVGASRPIETPVALFETSLASAITASADTMTLVSATTKDGASLASSTYSFIIDEGTASQEFVRADCTGTTCVRMERGLSVVTGTTTVTALQKSHRRGSSVKITDAPILLNLTRIIDGIGKLPNALSYSVTPTWVYGGLQLVTWDKAKDYTDGVALSGAPNADTITKGVVEIATQTEAASSTSLGSTLAQLVLPASMATDTPNTATRNSRVLMSSAAGYLKQAWLDLTQHFIFTSLFATNASSTNATTTSLYLNGRRVPDPKFGGTGTDGALSITSGTTTVALGTTKVYEKNYTSITISGTGALAFSSAATSTSGVLVVLRSTGNCDITGASNRVIDLRWLGGGLGSGKIGHQGGTSGSIGGGGGGGGGSTGGLATAGADIPGGSYPLSIGGGEGSPLPGLATSSARYVLPGGTGGAGAAGTGGSGGAGGLGGGALLLECAGTITFTTGKIEASGANGANAVTSGGGGGGGGGGNVVIIYGTLGSITGQITSTGGSGGSGTGTGGSNGGSGADGSSLFVQNTYLY